MRIWIAAFVLLSACNYNKVKTKQDNFKTVTSEKLEAPDFETVQAVVIGPKCVECHSTAKGNQGGTNLEGFAAVKSKLSRVIYRSLETRDMPPKNPLNEVELRVLRNWAESGAPEKVVGTGEKPNADLEKGPANWAKVRDGIFKSKCLDCHQAPKPDGDLDLSDIVQVREKMGKIVDRVFVKLDMPIAPYSSLTPSESRVFFKWISNGMPQ